MGILTRVKQKIFGDTGDPSQFGKIGSEAAGSPATTKDLALIQSLSQYLSGLYGITGNALELPRIEDINALYFLITTQLAYMFQAGVAEYDPTTDYFANISFVTEGGVIYVSKSGTGGTPNTGNLPSTHAANWRPIGGKVLLTQPASEATLTIADTKVLTVNKTLTLDGTDGKTLTLNASTVIQGTDGNIIDTRALIRSIDQGLLYTWVSNTSFSIGAGCRGDDTFVSTMLLASALTKTTSSWAVGTAAGGLDTGSIAANTWYYIYLIKRPDTGVVDVLFSTSPTSPTLPTNYTLKRLFDAVKTNGSSQFIQTIGYSDGTQEFVTVTNDVSDGALSTTKKTYALPNAPAIASDLNLYAGITSASALVSVALYGNTNLTDTGPNATTNNVVLQLANAASSYDSKIVPMKCLSGSIYARSTNASTSLYVSVRDYNIRPFC